MHLINSGVLFVKRKAANLKHRMYRGEITVAEAYDLLENYSPNPKSSCYLSRAPVLTHDYDVTVIVPTYNNEAFLMRCLDSIVNQRSQYKVQTIIVNDGSTDNTEKLLRLYEELPGVTVIHQQNMGLSGARNAALDISKGKYITFVDADDRLTEGAIQKMLDIALANGADVVAGNYATVLENGKLLGENRKYKDALVKPQGHLTGYAWGKLYISTIFDHLRFPVGYWFEDSIMAQIIWPSVKNVYTVSNIVYEYTVNPKGITATASNRPKSVDSLYITEGLLNDKKYFGLKLSSLDLDYFLSMVKLTYRRTCLCSMKIAKAIFVVECELYKQFAGLKSDKNLNLQKALAERVYSEYIKAVCK